MVYTNAIPRTAQPSQSLCQGLSVKSTVNGRIAPAKLSTYTKTREALFRLLATYPADMPVQQAVRLARIDFTKPRKEAAV